MNFSSYSEQQKTAGVPNQNAARHSPDRRTKESPVKKSPWKLDPLFTPRSIAVIGASPNGGAGSIVLRNMQRLGYTGTVYPINPKYKEIFGYPCYTSLRDLPAPADCAAVLLGSRSLLPMLEEAHAAGVKGVWGFASGFAETGGEGRAMQRRIHDFCHESGLLFCGPNCVGYANITDKTCMYSAPLPQAFRPGDIGVIAQSGAVLLALGNANRMAGFSRLISSGNEAALGLADYMDYLADDDATHVISLFIETIRDPEAFAAACSRAAEKGKPVIALKVGRSELACRVAATHTGAIAGSDRILDAFFRRANVMRVNTLDDLLETSVLFSGLRGLSAGSPKVGMATVSGGEMGMLADVCADSGLVFPPVSEAGKERLRKVLPPYAPIANPLDAWGSGDLREAYPASLGILAAEEDVETLIVSQDIPGNMAPEQVEQFSDVARAAVAVRAASGTPGRSQASVAPTVHAMCGFTVYAATDAPDIPTSCRQVNTKYTSNGISAGELYRSRMTSIKAAQPSRPSNALPFRQASSLPKVTKSESNTPQSPIAAYFSASSALPVPMSMYILPTGVTRERSSAVCIWIAFVAMTADSSRLSVAPSRIRTRRPHSTRGSIAPMAENFR